MPGDFAAQAEPADLEVLCILLAICNTSERRKDGAELRLGYVGPAQLVSHRAMANEIGYVLCFMAEGDVPYHGGQSHRHWQQLSLPPSRSAEKNNSIGEDKTKLEAMITNASQ
jgi:hypothetical protein